MNVPLTLKYPCFLQKREGTGYTLHCVRPSIFSDGNPQEAAEYMKYIMLDILAESLRDKEPFPLPDTESVWEGERVDVRFRPTETLKLLLINAMIETGTRPIDIAERLRISRREVSRILDPYKKTNLETLIRAVEATGKKLTVSLS